MSSAKILACGDVLIYDENYDNFFYDSSGDIDRKNFDLMVEDVNQPIKNADLALVNLEVATAGSKFPYSGYPFFNAPFSLADSLNYNGFDVFATANNHSLDYGLEAIKSEIDYFNKMGYKFIGTNSELSSFKDVLYFDVNDIRFAILSYTSVSNLPYPNSYSVNNCSNLSKISKAIDVAKKNSDCVIFMLHNGPEYVREPVESEKWIFDFLVENGVDIVFAGHSHTLQPVDFVKRDDGCFTYIVYSMGNFVGWMPDMLMKQVGAIFEITVTKNSFYSNRSFISLSSPKVYLTYSVNRGKIHKTIFFKYARNYVLNFDFEYEAYKKHISKYLDKNSDIKNMPDKKLIVE